MYAQIAKRIEESKRIAILSHVMPDGDNIGSSLALYNALLEMGKSAEFILDDTVPKVYTFLKGAEAVNKPDVSDDFDLAIALDCGDEERLGSAREYLKNKAVIVIDHHISNKGFGDINLIEVKASSTGELIYNLLTEMRVHLNKTISECIYTAMVTDTGQFQYSNTTERTLRIAAELVANGVSPSELFGKIYQSQPKSKILLIKKALESLEFFEGDTISCISLTYNQLQEIGAAPSETESIINYARDIEGVEVAAFLKETEDGRIRVSLRSKSKVDVSKLAVSFGGGGHMRASGCTISESLDAAKKLMLEAIIKEMHGGE